MSDAQATDRQASPEDQGLKALAVQLADDATAFVVAETSYLKAEFGERAEHIIATHGSSLAAIVMEPASPPRILGILMLAPIIGIVWAVVLVSGGSLLVGRLLALFGMRRIKASLKPKDER